MSSATRKQKRTEVNMMLASIFTSVRFCFHWHSAKHATDSERSEEKVRTAQSVSEGEVRTANCASTQRLDPKWRQLYPI